MLKLSSQKISQQWTYTYRQAQYKGPTGFPDVRKQYTDPIKPECVAPNPDSKAHQILKKLHQYVAATTETLSSSLNMPLHYIQVILEKLEENGCVSKNGGDTWTLSDAYQEPHKPKTDF